MSDTLVLRPAPAPRRLVYRITAVISVVLVIAGVMAGGRPALITCIGLVLLLAVAVALYLWRSRIVVTPAEISARGLWFHHRSDRGQAASLVRAMVIHPGAAPAETIVVFDSDEHALLRINGALYASADIDRLVDHLGLPTGGPDRPVTTGQLARERPGTVGWIGRHPVAFTLLCALGFAVLAVVLGAVVAALSG